MSEKSYLKTVDFEKAVSSIQDYEFALLYFISEMKLEKIEYLAEIDYEELLEGYFFSENGQLHLYRGEDGGLQGVIASDSVPDGVHLLEKKYELNNKAKKKGFGKYLLVKEYLEKDEDGQNYVGYTRMVTIGEVKE